MDSNANEISTQEIFNPKIKYGSSPIMLRSMLCFNNLEHYNYFEVEEGVEDPGGYFIVSGGEKVIIAQEQMKHNKAFLFNNLLILNTHGLVK